MPHLSCFRLTLCLALATAPIAFAADAKTLWSEKVQKILDVNCVKCHGPLDQKSGLELDTPDAMRGRVSAVNSVFVGAYPSPRSYGTFPRVLGEFVREERVLRIEDAVRKMTSLPANRLGLVDRGLVKDRFFADLVVFDPRTVKHLASYENPCVYPEGIHHVFVNGVPTLLDGQSTGSRPGHALRRR